MLQSYTINLITANYLVKQRKICDIMSLYSFHKRLYAFQFLT